MDKGRSLSETDGEVARSRKAATRRNARLLRLARRYRTALRIYLQAGPRARPTAAEGLGRQAVALRLETLDLARIHRQALASLDLPGDSPRTRDRRARRAERFFTDVLPPIERTHQAARQTKTQLQRLSKTLHRRTRAIASSRRHLQRGEVRRRRAEHALERSSEQRARLLAQARRLQRRLRRLAHRTLAAQEDKRRKMSRELHDEIAQALLGVHVRLLTLKRGMTVHTRDVKKQIATTRRLVGRSATAITRFAREFGSPHEN